MQLKLVLRYFVSLKAPMAHVVGQSDALHISVLSKTEQKFTLADWGMPTQVQAISKLV